MDQPVSLKIPDAVRTSFAPVMAALGPARQQLGAVQDVVSTRPGYAYSAHAASVPAIVVAVTPSTTPVKAADLQQQFGVPFSVIDATVEEQLAASKKLPVSFGTPGGSMVSAFEQLMGGDETLMFAPPKSGSYEEPTPPNLPLVKEKMDLTICVSPEAGWGELEAFLGATTSTLTVAMYQFTAPHIFKAVADAVEPAGRSLELILHPVPEKPAKSGVKAKDVDEETGVIAPLEAAMDQRFDTTWATLVTKAHPDGLFASAYHIKVAVRDGATFWLSSGNWQSSNQPDVHPFATNPQPLPAGFQRKYNRDYHAIIDNKKLAGIYEFYIKRDFTLCAAQAGKTQGAEAPDLFVPEDQPDVTDFAAQQLFKPLRISGREISVQPLLTPDNYADHALRLIQSATQSVWFQNQYINFRGTDDDFPAFRSLIEALKDKIDSGLDVRIICRDMMKQESLDVLIALGFPKEVFRFQPACHNKTIIVDGKIVMFGSHNWSNEGVVSNRDASLIFDDEEIATYLAGVYDYDWNTLATAHPTKARPRVAKPGEATPPGHKRVAFSAVFEDGM